MPVLSLLTLDSMLPDELLFVPPSLGGVVGADTTQLDMSSRLDRLDFSADTSHG